MMTTTTANSQKYTFLKASYLLVLHNIITKPLQMVFFITRSKIFNFLAAP